MPSSQSFWRSRSVLASAVESPIPRFQQIIDDNLFRREGGYRDDMGVSWRHRVLDTLESFLDPEEHWRGCAEFGAVHKYVLSRAIHRISGYERSIGFSPEGVEANLIYRICHFAQTMFLVRKSMIAYHALGVRERVFLHTITTKYVHRYIREIIKARLRSDLNDVVTRARLDRILHFDNLRLKVYKTLKYHLETQAGFSFTSPVLDSTYLSGSLANTLVEAWYDCNFGTRTSSNIENHGRYFCHECGEECSGAPAIRSFGDPICHDCTHLYTWSDGEDTYVSTQDTEDYEQDMWRGILSYNADPLEYLPAKILADKENENALLLGVELEVERSNKTQSGTSEKIAEVFKDFAILKSDGSLQDGFEIVTAPASLEAHRQSPEWLEFDKDLRKQVKSFTTDTCGLHVHADRNYLSPLTIGKLACFINAYENHERIARIAGRVETQYSKRVEQPVSHFLGKQGKKYQWLNLTKGPTIEFRMFRGNTKRKGIMRCIEFVHASIHFCQSVGCSELTFENFCNYIIRPENRRMYDNLLDFMLPRFEELKEYAQERNVEQDKKKYVTRNYSKKSMPKPKKMDKGHYQASKVTGKKRKPKKAAPDMTYLNEIYAAQ